MDSSFIEPPTFKGWQLLKETISHQEPGHLNAPGYPLTEHDNPFDLFFPDNILSQICNFTNESYNNFIKTNQKQNSIIQDWYSLTIDELKTYIGVFLMMGIDKKPETSQYWSTDGLWSSVLIRKSMSINRFFAINKFIEVGSKDITKKLERLNFLSNHIKSVSQSLYFPSKKLLIGRSQFDSKAKYTFKNYPTIKTQKLGFKVFFLSEPGTGYCIKHLFYKGDKGENLKPFNLAKKLVEGLDHSYKHIFADKWFSSLDLVKYLKSVGINYTGTIKSSMKGLPTIDAVKNELKDQKILFFMKNNLNLVVWEDKQTVTMISNVVDTEFILETRLGKLRVKKDFYMPKIFKDYKVHIDGVDLLDQRFMYYCYDHYFKKPWKYFFLYLVEIAINNSFVIQNKGRNVFGKSLLSYIDYRIELIKSLVNSKEIEMDKGICEVEYKHYLIKSEAKNCFICFRERKKSKCNFYCNGCCEFMHKECFLLEHNLLK